VTLEYDEKKKSIIWEYLIKCSFEDNNFQFKAPIIMNSSYFTKLNEWIGKQCKYTLIFRASRDGYTRKAFHDKCDGMAPTVTIIKTNYNKVIGGYTTLKWTSKGEWLKDPSNTNFTFSMDSNKKQKILPNCPYAIICSSSYGPSFGVHSFLFCNGNDDCRVSESCYSDGNLSSGVYYEAIGVSEFMGGTNGKFSVVDYEVFLAE